MRRMHLVELEDLDWLPRAVRDAGTDYLHTVIRLGKAYRPIAPHLARALSRAGADHVVDLCSGGGGPWPGMREELAREGAAPTVRLTDLYPNENARARLHGAEGVELYPRPVDATAPPPDLSGFRTLFSAFHHFPPEQARAILAAAVARGEGIGVFELTQRRLPAILAILPAPLMVLLLTPFIRPFRWSRLFWTYLLPVVPLFVLWDGIVSCLRSYTPEELREMAESLGAEGYRWEAGTLPSGGPAPATYLLGWPEGAEVRARRAPA